MPSSLASLQGPLSLLLCNIWLERRLLALWQDRYGPNRVGPFGLFQVLADMIKILTKEDWIPPFADRPVFVITPGIIVVTVLSAYAVIPFSPQRRSCRPRHRRPLFPSHVVPRRLQHRPGRLVVGQ